MVNAENNPTRYTFDGLSRMSKRERALTTGATIEDFTKSQDTIWAFDKNSRMTSFKDDGPNETTWNFDALDRAIKQTFPDTKTVLFEHDLAHNVTKTTDPSGNVTNDTFDDLNRNTSRSVTLATGFVGTTSETRAYDELDRMVTNEDNDYKLQYEYAVIGLRSYVAKETQSYVSGYTLSKTVTKTYDAVGNRITEAYPSGSNLSLANTYDAINQLTAIGDGTNTLASFNRIGWRSKTTTFQSGATATTSYTGFRNEVASVHHQTNAPATILRLDYGYNKVHDRTYERFGAAGSPGDAYLYDKMRRLTNAYLGSTVPTAPAANPYVKKLDYNYDDDGNRQSMVTTLWGLAPTNAAYTTNNLNQYTVVAGTSRTHDNNGNLTNDGTSKYVYNYKNLIVEARLSSTNALYASYKYDAEGRRVEKSVVAGKFERYIRSRAPRKEGSCGPCLSEPEQGGRYKMSQVVATFDSNGAWKQNLVWGERIDQIAVLEQADVLDYDGDSNTAEITRSYYHTNALGSVMEITDANQAAVVSYGYSPYGEMTITRGGVTQGADPLGQYWGYTARFSDEETELWYYRARYYDGATGRFLQRDPLGYTAGPGLYEYVDSAPVSWVDPSGLLLRGSETIVIDVLPVPLPIKLIIKAGVWGFAVGVGIGVAIKSTRKRNCASEHSEWPNCVDVGKRHFVGSWFKLMGHLRRRYGDHVKIDKKKTGQKCPGGGGIHRRASVRGTGVVATILECTCCEDTPSGPVLRS